MIVGRDFKIAFSGECIMKNSSLGKNNRGFFDLVLYLKKFVTHNWWVEAELSVDSHKYV